MSENTNERRLPPPAFPPGMRRHVHTNSQGPEDTTSQDSSADAYISPDDPMPERHDAVSGAFILPDEPIPERRIQLVEEFQDATAVHVEPGEEGEVVGMDLDSHLEPEEIVSGGDPHVMEVIDAVGKLAESLARKGEAGLRSTREMSRFEATLRSYCVGYLAGRRAEEPAPPIVEAPLPTDG